VGDVQDGEDPFTRLEREKVERVKGNRRRQEANIADAAPASAAPAAIPATVKLSTKLDPASMCGQIAKGKAIKAELKQVRSSAHTGQGQHQVTCSTAPLSSAVLDAAPRSVCVCHSEPQAVYMHLYVHLYAHILEPLR
jgi:hypothetical protein